MLAQHWAAADMNGVSNKPSHFHVWSPSMKVGMAVPLVFAALLAVSGCTEPLEQGDSAARGADAADVVLGDGSAEGDAVDRDATIDVGDGSNLDDVDDIDAPSTDASSDAGENTDTATVDTPDPGPQPRRVRVMTYNIQHATSSNPQALADVINAANPDIVCLQEVDKHTPRSPANQARRLGRLTGMHHRFKSTRPHNGGYTGLAVLSRFPIKKVWRVRLTSTRYPRILMMVKVELDDGTIMTVGNTHLGLQPEVRQTQAREVRSVLKQKSLAVLGGDFNSYPTGAVHNIIDNIMVDTWGQAGSGPGETSPAGHPRHRIDYIWRTRDWARARRGNVINTTASDHRPVVVNVVRHR
jgi:endonuclease/exonuclease/phosphatase family metal-dependent hydrolase